MIQGLIGEINLEIKNLENSFIIRGSMDLFYCCFFHLCLYFVSDLIFVLTLIFKGGADMGLAIYLDYISHGLFLLLFSLSLFVLC